MLGSLLGGVASSVAGLLGKKSDQKMQMKFAKNGIQWKVDDAKAAGINPYYALGANTMSYQPVGVGDGFGWLSDMGQNIDRARMATSDSASRGSTVAMEKLSLEKAGLENDLLRAEIAAKRAQLGPPMPTGGSGALTAFGVPISTVPGETEAQDWENRYGDFATDAIGAARLVRDADRAVTNDMVKKWVSDNFSYAIREGSVADEIWRWFNNRQISYSGKRDRERR